MDEAFKYSVKLRQKKKKFYEIRIREPSLIQICHYLSLLELEADKIYPTFRKLTVH
jgi:hypothetical protein